MKKMNSKGILSLILVVAMMFVVVFGVRKASPVNSGSTNDTPAAAEGGNIDAADGTYVGEADGFGGKIIAEVTIAGGAITDVKVTGDSETEGLGSVAVEKLPGMIVAAQSLDVDMVSGATVSSKAVLLAVTNALAEAN